MEGGGVKAGGRWRKQEEAKVAEVEEKRRERERKRGRSLGD